MNESESMKEIKKQTRRGKIEDRIEEAHKMIGAMCSEGRPPRMSVPVQGTDEDQFISILLDDLLEMIQPLQKMSFDKGYVVSTSSLSAEEIAAARENGRLYVNADSLGWVWFPHERNTLSIAVSRDGGLVSILGVKRSQEEADKVCRKWIELCDKTDIEEWRIGEEMEMPRD